MPGPRDEKGGQRITRARGYITGRGAVAMDTARGPGKTPARIPRHKTGPGARGIDLLSPVFYTPSAWVDFRRQNLTSVDVRF